jgi:hypothetical protein
MMRMSVVALTLLTLCLLAVPAGTQSTPTANPASIVTLYNNGPVDGDDDAFTINTGFSVTNSMFIGPVQSYATVTAISFEAWLLPTGCINACGPPKIGDYVTSVQVQIGTAPFDNSIFDGVVTSWVTTNCASNAYGYQLCLETAQFRGPTLTVGGSGTTYWLTLQNAVTSNGGIANTDPVYWDQNSGPSQAQDSQLGTIPSESFTVLGYYSSAPPPAAGAGVGKNQPGTPTPGPTALSSSGR